MNYAYYRYHIESNSTLQENGCWRWNRCHNGHYPLHGLRNQESRYAHRMAWRAFNEREIDTNLVINHKCRNSMCVNPEHLEITTQQHNVQVGEKGRFGEWTCRYGHELTVFPDGRRRCKTCRTNYSNRRSALRAMRGY